jgi:hypothetical protein
MIADFVIAVFWECGILGFVLVMLAAQITKSLNQQSDISFS